VLVLEGMATLFVPRGIAQSGPELAGPGLTVLLVLAVLLIRAAGVQRRPSGLVVGTALQVPLLLTGLPRWLAGAELERPARARLEREIGRPPVSWMLGVGTMIFWHVPVLFNAALANDTGNIQAILRPAA